MTRILFKYPTRARPALFRRTLSRLLELLSGKHDYRFVISCDADDETMNNPEMRKWIDLQGAKVYFNQWPQTKVSAINANIAGQPFDVFCLCSDDMIPQDKGYDDRLVTLLYAHFPDGDGVLHTDDGRVGQKLNTQAVFGRAYYDRFGYVYSSQYVGLWCDNELQAVSESLGRSAYVDEVIFRHEWTNATGVDALHLKNEASYEADAKTFERRRLAGFP